MMNFIRLWEKISGIPHLHRNAEMVSEAANSLAQRTQEFHQVIRPYIEADDPLTAVMMDLYEQRRRDAQPKLHT